MPLPAALSPQQTADQIGCSRQHVYTLLRSGALKAHKVGRLTRINTRDVLALVGGDDRDGAH